MIKATWSIIYVVESAMVKAGSSSGGSSVEVEEEVQLL